MSVAIVHAGSLDVGALARVAAEQQAEPARRIAFVSEEAETIAFEISQLAGWQRCAFAAVEEGSPVGLLLADVDLELGRAWWWGPFAPAADWDATADRLYAAACDALPAGVAEQEVAADAANLAMARFCARHGFAAAEASVLLERSTRIDARGDRVQRDAGAHAAQLAKLHDQLFPAAHHSGRQLAEARAAADVVVVAVVVSELAGYAAGQLQPGNTGYIDFVGVDPAHRRQGLGGELVAGLGAALFDAGATHLHLTVRESNAAARALYGSLGFTELQVLVPYRRGFEIP